ncbi:hypothetical protein KP806_14095 [Paenibacillus sp. N4]|uniref:hypothetical protein n=1 Tax=Paenibacillus vietnamensis TaxID=2590547 RepID=UPI001CD120A5|nr:hypothetical protein [Paenibacillus vietnamensis]MCA0756183.1 hypothetical protein [Paenibacillus vietnamensis]
MANEFENEKREIRSLATEKDIDPKFGLFTEETAEGAVQEADDLLLEKYPSADAEETRLRNEGWAEGELEDVPDADDLSANSEVDAAAPEEEFHGTDLLNGVGKHPEEETESEPW